MADRFEIMLGALEKSVVSILDAPVNNRQAFLKKTTGQFRKSFEASIGEELESAFQNGLTGNIRKFAGSGKLGKNLGGVAEFATLLRAAENSAKAMEVDRMDSNAGANSAAMQAIREWVMLGKKILSMLVGEANGDMPLDDAPPVNEVVAQVPEPVMGAEQGADMDADMGAEGDVPVEGDVPPEFEEETFGKLAKRLRKAMKTYTRMSKAEGDAEGGEEATRLEDLDPIDVIGRLAAAIVMQVDALKNPEGEGGEEELPEGEGDVEKMDGAEDEEEEYEEEPEEGDKLEKEDDEGVAAEDEEEDEDEDEEKKEEIAKRIASKGKPGKGKSGLGKSAPVEDRRIASLEKMVHTLQAELKKVNGQPAPAKGKRLTVVDKSADSVLAGKSADALEKMAKEIDALPAEEKAVRLIKLAQASGGRRL